MCCYIMFKAEGRFITKVFHYPFKKVLFYAYTGRSCIFLWETFQDFLQNTIRFYKYWISIVSRALKKRIYLYKLEAEQLQLPVSSLLLTAIPIIM